MALLYLGEDPWLSEYESCEKLQRDIMELMTERQQFSRSSDNYSQLSANIRLRLKQFNNEVDQLKNKLDISTVSGAITPAESERRTRQIEVLATKAVQMQKIFEQQVSAKALEERRQLMGSSGLGLTHSVPLFNPSVDDMRVEQRAMLREQEEGLQNLSKIISRQKEISSVISTEVDFHNEILNDITTQVDNTDARVRAETQHVSVIDRKDNTCGYWIIIILLFIGIIVAATV
ncbi:syntaxin-8 [Cylas formicarius]|uniref:syntaxin-8 n=1 Tax=Cylas formicarius TaxID=197179 RepID=UPI0029589F7E|nr:syntaxin-8 [Cylas formicarius]